MNEKPSYWINIQFENGPDIIFLAEAKHIFALRRQIQARVVKVLERHNLPPDNKWKVTRITRIPETFSFPKQITNDQSYN